MTILKLALLGSLRIIAFGSLKIGLFVYALFLSDTVVVAVGPEGTRYVGDEHFHAPRAARPRVTLAEQDTWLHADRASP